MGSSLSSWTVRSNLFFPKPRTTDEYAVLEKPGSHHVVYDGVSIHVVDGRPECRSQACGYDKAVVFSHGNASDVLDMAPFVEELAKKLRVVVVSYDYEGYGLTASSDAEGSCGVGIGATEEGCYRSLATAVSYCTDRLFMGADSIYLVGQSLGTGVVAGYADRVRWKNPIMLVSPYETVLSVVLPPSVVAALGWLDMFKTMRRVPSLACPVKVVHGINDELIGVEQGIRLQQLAEKRGMALRAHWLDAGHNDIVGALLIHPVPFVELLRGQ